MHEFVPGQLVTYYPLTRFNDRDPLPGVVLRLYEDVVVVRCDGLVHPITVSPASLRPRASR